MIFSTILLSASAVQATAATEPPVMCNGAQVKNINSATMAHVRVAEPAAIAAVSRPEGATPAADLFEVGNGGAPYGYSRLRVKFTQCNADQRRIGDEKRHPVRRFFFGKQADKILKLKVTVKPLGVSSSTTLASIHRKSGKDGEEWTTEIENDGILLPYFRVDSNSLVRVEADFQSTREYNSSVSGDALDIIKRASALISPTAPLITAQNKDRFNDASSFVDSSVNGLLKVSITEKPSLAVAISPNGKDQPLAVITLVAPGANDTYPDRRGMIAIGQWEIFADKVRPSMLSTHKGGLVAGSYTASSVMNFSVSEEKTLKESLAGSSSVTAARDALISAAEKDSVNAGRTFCRTVATEADALGLAPIDVGIATWAALTDLALSEGKMKNAKKGCSEVENFPAAA